MPEERPGAETVVQGADAAQDSRSLSLPADAVQHPDAPKVAGYALSARLGRGTYGEVWRAWQLRTGKWVALKAYTRREGLDFALFRREAERLAQLDRHPGIVALLDADFAVEPPYCALELVGGGSLAGKAPSPPDAVAGWLESASEALAFVHSRGVIHCDLKPANILLDEEGRPRVADFGQSRGVGAESALGSFFFMAPEQAAGRGAPDVRWDVYGLGATAYFLLTGRPPHAQAVERALSSARTLEERLAAYRAAVEQAGAPGLPPSVDADLAAIVRKCLEPDPARRYSSAGMALFDLRNRREGRPVTPLAGSAAYRARKFVRRNAVAAAIAAAAVLGLAEAGRRLVVEGRTLRAQLAKAYLAQAQLSADLGDASRAVSFSAESNVLRPSHLGRANTFSYLADLPVPRFVFSGTVSAASADGRLVAGAYKRQARAWDAATGAPAGPAIALSDEATALALSPDGSRLAIGFHRGRVALFDPRTGAAAGAPYSHAGAVVALRFSPDGRWLATGSEDKTARLLDAATGAPAGQAMRHDDHVHSLAFFPDGKRLATASEEDFSVRLWSVPDGRPLLAPIRVGSKVYAVDVSPDGRRVAAASLDKLTHVYDARTGRELLRLAQGGRVMTARYSPDGARLLTAGFDETARLWDARTGAPVGRPMRHEGTVKDAEFSPDGRLVLTTAADDTSRVWDAATQRPLGGAYQHASIVQLGAFLGGSSRFYTQTTGGLDRVWEVARPLERGAPLDRESTAFTAAFSGDGRLIAAASRDKKVRVRDRRGRLLLALAHPAPVRAAALSLDGSLLLTGAHDGARLWRVTDGSLRAKLLDGRVDLLDFAARGGRGLAASRSGELAVFGPDGAVLARWKTPARPYFAVLSPDGRWAAEGGRDGKARLWDAATGTLKAVMAHDDAVEDGAFYPDGGRLVTAGRDRTARIWSVPDGKRVTDTRIRHRDAIRAVAVSPDGSLIATGGDDQQLRFWDARTGDPRGRKMLHRGPVRAVAFSPDGKTLVSGSEDQTARLWDVEEGVEIGQPMVHQSRVVSARFSPDGKALVTAGADNPPRLWPLDWLYRYADAEDLRRRARLATVRVVNERGDLDVLPPDDWKRLAGQR
jgi:WD40 repeat protein